MSKPILCMCFGPIGDTLIMLALFDDILALDQASRFTVITSSNAKMIRDLASAYPSVEVLEIPSKPASLPGFFARVLSRSWTVLVPGSARGYSLQLTLFFMALSMRPGNLTIGFGDIRKQGGWLPFQKKLYVNIHEPILDNYRRMIPYFMPKAALPTRPAEVKINPIDPASFRDKLPFQPKKYFLVHMFGTRPRLSFPPKRWKIFIAELSKKYPDYGIVLTGSKKDEALIREIAADTSRIYVSINRPILEVAGMVKNAAVYIGVDTGITHLAAMLRMPSVIVGNNSNPLWWPSYNPNGTILVNSARCTCTGDKNDDCRVYEDGVGYHRCTFDITLDQVYAAIALKLKS
jgi:ADP-heptose:LPS heptosyltransferase